LNTGIAKGLSVRTFFNSRSGRLRRMVISLASRSVSPSSSEASADSAALFTTAAIPFAVAPKQTFQPPLAPALSERSHAATSRLDAALYDYLAPFGPDLSAS